MGEQTVEQRVVGVCFSGHGRKTRALLDDEEVLVFVPHRDTDTLVGLNREVHEPAPHPLASWSTYQRVRPASNSGPGARSPDEKRSTADATSRPTAITPRKRLPASRRWGSVTDWSGRRNVLADGLVWQTDLFVRLTCWADGMVGQMEWLGRQNG